jgi:hypothetical protein
MMVCGESAIRIISGFPALWYRSGPATFTSGDESGASEILECGRSEVCMEALTIDCHRIELLQLSFCRQLIALIALISFQAPKVDIFNGSQPEVFRCLRVMPIHKQDV